MPSDAFPPFDVTRFSALVTQRVLRFGRPCRYDAVTGSTSDDLMAAARQGAAAGTLHVADYQTQGRGRHGNTWSSPRTSENLLFSLLLRPNIPIERVSCFTLAVGLALREAIQPHVTQRLGVKWTNDLFVENRKLAGILVESQLRGAEVAALVVGIGLNVHMTKLPDEIATIATSMAMLGANCLDRELLLVDILASLERYTARYEAAGLAGILDELRAHDAILGKRVRVGERAGIACGISDSGALLLDQGLEGGVVELTNGLVELAPLAC